MSVKIGVSPISWTNDDMPELGKDTTVEHCLTEGKQAGYRGFELGGKWPKDSEILRPLFDKYSMDVVSSWFCGGLLADSLCLLYTSPSPRDVEESRMPSSA